MTLLRIANMILYRRQ